MLRLLVCALLLTVGLAYVDDSIISKINSNPASTWTAGVNYVLLDKKLEQVARLCGTILRERVPNPISADTNDVENAVPASFDSRQAWPKCPSLSEIRNQAECGSCWAFGAVETLTDRYCIASNQTTNPRLSALNLVACDENDSGCQGGDLESAWDYLQNSGIPTEDCQPYTIPTCPPDQQPCLNFVDTPDCPSACNGNQTGPVTKLYYAKNGYSVGGWSGSAAAMQKEIMTNGPIEAAFTVYADFVHYKSGVYSHQTGSALGGHAVKIIGWGVDSTSNTPYWLVANSWTTSWGDDGYFKIKRGNDECGIESQAYVGLAKFP